MKKRLPLNFLLSLGVALLPGRSFAAPQTWNPGGAGGGSGNWADRNWNSASSWLPGGTALFGGPAGTVAVGKQAVGGLIFKTTGYALSAGTLNLTGVPAFDLGKGVTATLDGSLTLTGAGGLAKTGPGTLQLSAATTYTGATTVRAGILRFTGTPPKGAVSVDAGAVLALPSPGAVSLAGLNLNGGTLNLGTSDAPLVTLALALKNARLCFGLGDHHTGSLLVEHGTTSVGGVNGIRLVTGGGLSPGVYPLIEAPGGGLAGSFQFDGGENLSIPATSQIRQVGGAWYRLLLQDSATAVQVVVAPAPAHVVNILPLGSSSTAGFSAVQTYNGGGYRSGFYQALVNDGRFTPNFIGSQTLLAVRPAATGYNVLTGAGQTHHEGHGGYTTSDILVNLISNPGTRENNGGCWLAPGNGVNPDYVTLDIGSNDYAYDQHQTRGPLDRTDAILSRLAALRPRVHVIVTNLPYRGDRGGAAAALANSRYNPFLPGVVYNHTLAGHHVAFVDGYSAVTPRDSAEWISSDLIHLKQEGYNRLAAAFFRSFVDGSAYWTGRQGNRWDTVAAGRATNFAQDRGLSVDRNKTPDAGTDVYFDRNTAALLTVLGQDLAVRGVNFAAGATGPVTVAAGNTLTLGAGGITVQSGSGVHVIAAGVVLGDDQTWGNVTTNTFTATGPVSGPGRLTMTGSYTIQVPVADTGNATRLETHSGTGPIVLTGANTYTGGTTIRSGTLVANNPGGSATGPGGVRVLPGAVLTNDGGVGGEVNIEGTANGHGVFAGAVTVRDGGQLSGPMTVKGPLNVERGGRVRLPGGTLTAQGGIVNEGTVRLESGGALALGAGHPFINGGVLEVVDNRFSLPAAFTNWGAVIDGSAVPTQTASLAGGVLTLTVDGRSGHAYQLQRGPSLSGGDFTDVGPPQSPVENAVLTFVDDKPDAARGFYRVRATP